MLKINTPFSDVDSSQKFALGSRTLDSSSNEYIYLQGTAGVTQYDLVLYDSNYLCKRAVAGDRGPFAVAQGAVLGSKYGWFLIKGRSSIRTNGTVAGNKNLFLTASAGAVDDAIVAGDLILGAFSSVDGISGAGTMTNALFNYPWAGSLSVA